MHNMTRRTVLVALVTLAACQDAAETTGPEIQPNFLKTAVTADGTRIGVLPDTASRRETFRIEYRAGRVMPHTSNVYFIWYGDWQGIDPAAVTVLTDFITSVGGSSYFSTVRQYTDWQGYAPSAGLVYGGATTDLYSHTSTLTRADVADVVQQALARGDLPGDTRGIYVVLGSSDIWVDGLNFDYCAMHDYATMFGSNMKYIFIGSPARAPSRCAPQYVGPNGTLAADAMASLLAAELANTVTDPQLDAWYDRLGYEMADKCAWNYGTTYTAANGARANVKLGTRDYLLQQLWSPQKAGSCTLGAP